MTRMLLFRLWIIALDNRSDSRAAETLATIQVCSAVLEERPFCRLSLLARRVRARENLGSPVVRNLNT